MVVDRRLRALLLPSLLLGTGCAAGSGSPADRGPTRDIDSVTTVAGEADRSCPSAVAGPPGARCLARLASSSPYGSVQATLAPDGRHLAYEVADGGRVQIHLLDLESARSVALTSGAGRRRGPTWSPDGSRIAVSGQMLDVFGKTADGIGVIDARSGRERLILRSAFDLVAVLAWTPEGRIVFERREITIAPSPASTDRSAGGRAPASAWVMDADGTNVEPWLPGSYRLPRFSPDGRRIAFVRPGCGEGEAPGLWVASVRDGNRRCLLQQPEAIDLAWSADGDSLYLAGATAGDTLPGLWVVPVSGTGVARRVPLPDGRIAEVDVAPGAGLFVSMFQAGTDFGVVPVPGGVPQSLRVAGTTDLWKLRSPAPDAVPPPRPEPEDAVAVELLPGEIRAAAVDSVLLGTALTIETAAPRIRGLWPGFWDGTQAYALREQGEPGEPGEAIAVVAGPSPAGFRPIAAVDLPPGVRGRIHHARGPAADVEELLYDVPVLVLGDSLQEPPPVWASVLEQEVYEVYRSVFLDPDAGLLARPARRESSPRTCRSGCPHGSARGCAAMILLEERLLRQAVSRLRAGGDDADVAGRLRAFAAVHWLRTHDADRERFTERVLGVSAHVARRAAMLAVGRDTVGYRPETTLDAWPPFPRGGPESRQRMTRSGQVIALLLDAVDTGWRDEVREGANLQDALFRATGLTKANALAAATNAMEAYDFQWFLYMARAQDSQLPKGSNAIFYLSALCDLAPPVPALRVDFPSGLVATDGDFTLRWTPGPAGVARPGGGIALLADPEHVELTVGDLRMVVRGRPVGIVRHPHRIDDRVQVVVYPARDLESSIRGRDGSSEGEARRIEGDGLELWMGSGTRVHRASPNTIVLMPGPRR